MHKRALSCVLGVVASTLVLINPASAAPSDPLAGQRVTLITGDVVTSAGGQIGIEPAKRDRPVAFERRNKNGDEYVIPADAADMVAAGKLDKELFNITGLIRQRYDDAHTDSVPVLIEGAARTERRFGALDLASVNARKGSWREIAGSGRKVWLNAKLSASLDVSVPQTGAPAAWHAGLTGQGVTVAVLDSGIDATHPDLAGKVALSKDFTGSGSTNDVAGHGTHVASTIAGSDAKYRGVAPDARLAVGKVLDDTGFGETDDIIEGMRWAVIEAKAKVVNMSLGGGESDGTDPISQAVNELSKTHGTLFVISAGNANPRQKVSAPAAADAALAVANLTKGGEVSPTSSRGPRVGDAAMKPEIAAPGTDITAARAKDSPGEGGHVTKSGTSMAAPHVAGAAAILAGQHPDWSGETIKSALVTTASPVAAHPYEAGNGRVDLARATTSPVQVTPSSVSANLKWPETKPRENIVTYRNTGSAPLTLSLSVELKDATGQAAPAALATLSASSLTIAPGASASATLTSTPRSRPGQYGGALKATTVDGQVSRTPVSIQDEAEAYDLTVAMLDRDGQAVTNGFVIAVEQLTAQRIQMVPGRPARLPGGKYTIMALFGSPAGYTVRFAHPLVNLDRTTTVELDARQARRVSLQTDQPSVERSIWVSTMWMKVANGPDRVGLTNFAGLGDEVYAYSPPNVTSPLFTYFDAYRLETPDDKRLELAFPVKGSVPANLAYSVRTPDLATVNARYYGQTEEAPPIIGAANMDFDVPVGTSFFSPTPPSKQRLEYFTPGTWQLSVSTARDSSRWQDIALAAGGSYQVEWNRAVLSPGFAGTTSSELGENHPWAFRRSNLMPVNVPFYTDAAGHTVMADTEHGTTTGTTSLYTGDRLVGTQNLPGMGVFWVGQSDERFRLVAEANRDQPWWPLSTNVSSEWTFTARFRQGPFDTPLPLLAVRAEPPVGLDNKSPSGPVEIPLSVSRQDGPLTVADLALEYSADDGATWQQAPITSGKAAVTNPAGGFVSLRVKATDTNGNSVTTTVIRAYEV